MNLGAPEIITILVVALLIFGPKKLPELGRSLGSGIREFRKGTQGLKEELEQSFKDEVSAPQSATPVVAQPVAVQTVVPSPPTVSVTKGAAIDGSEPTSSDPTVSAGPLSENPKA